ncbi:MAG: hypothetical protein EGR81_07190 [Ruminococcaceae bacterium]|nr:hypothetical protein [Oscillospiraceae bacterium]
MNERPADVQSRSVTEPQREGVVYDDGGDKEKLIEEIFQGAAVIAPYGKFRKRHISCDLSNINR